MTTATKTRRPAKAKKNKGSQSNKGANNHPVTERLSALDAAERVLKETKKPMHAGELIDAMAERKLWESPVGKTPTATLFAAMLREIAVKGDDSRFAKMDRGLFGLKPWERRRNGNVKNTKR